MASNLLPSFQNANWYDLIFQDDDRRYIALSTFGFYQGGVLEVKLSNFLLPMDDIDGTVSNWSFQFICWLCLLSYLSLIF